LSEIRIVREHGLGLHGARQLARRWAEVAETKLQAQCVYEGGETHDVVRFRRPGASGELHVGAERFELDAKLGLLLGMLKPTIEREIARNLDELLAQEDPLQAFEHGLARHHAKHAAKHAKPHADAHKAFKPGAPSPAKKTR
jgi:putative polyhydroxyalkanoate system protein